MKINSITIQEIDSVGFVVATSETKFNPKRRPETKYPDVNSLIDPKLKKYKASELAYRVVITVSTSRGKFVKSYALHSLGLR